MKWSFPILVCLVMTTPLLAELHTKTVEYKVGGATFEGYFAWDDTFQGARPGVIVVHEWWGNNAYSRRRAEELAQLGYVGFAIDMYGKGNVTEDPQKAQAWASEISKNPDKAKARAQAAIELLRKHPQVEPQRLAAIGYCFGGAVALNMARWNMGVMGVVSFHGDLSNPKADQQGQIAAKVLVLAGADDKFVPQAQIEAFKQEMARAGAECSVVVYPEAQHAFTNPEADKYGIDNVRYNAEADRESWDEMQRFLQELFQKQK